MPSNAKKKIILNNDNDDRRLLFETCTLKSKRVCNPIIDWTDDDVWGFIREQKLPVNPLYGEGFSRVGCVGCPMAGKKRYGEFERWPEYRNMYMSAFGRMLDERKRRALPTTWNSAEDVFHWWMEDGAIPGQLELDLTGATDEEE